MYSRRKTITTPGNMSKQPTVFDKLPANYLKIIPAGTIRITIRNCQLHNPNMHIMPHMTNSPGM